MDRFNEAGVPSGPINSIDQVFDDPQIKHLRVAQPLNSPALGPIEVVAQPVTLSDTPSTMRVAPPEPGEHTDEIMREFGYGAEEIAAFRQGGVI
jgi:formyl-CoA transferase